jgi:hypothetical protein
MALVSKKLNVRIIDEDDEGGPYVLIEGSKPALESLAQLILDHASGQNGCGLQIGPDGPCRSYFSKTASHGIYMHLLPCVHPTEASERVAGRKP